MAVAGDTGYLAGGLLGVIEAEAIARLAKVSVTRNLCSVKSAPKGDTISWIMYNDSTHVIDSGDVTNTAEGTVTPTSKLQSVKKTATMDMYSVGTDLYDEARLSDAGSPESELGRILGNAVAAKIDNLLNANFDNFSTSVGTSTVAITVDNLFSALSEIEAYQHLSAVSGVLHRKQIWGTNGLMNDLVTSSQFGGSPTVQGDALVNGFTGKVAGIDLYNSNELTEASSAVKGGVFTRDAFGWGYVGQEIVVEKERQSDYIRDRYNAHFFAGTTEISDSAGVELWTKTS